MNPEIKVAILEQQLNQAKQDLKDLTEEVYRNNFSGRQDFYKTIDCKTRLKVPHYASLPSTCEIGEIAETGGVLKICSSANTWTSV